MFAKLFNIFSSSATYLYIVLFYVFYSLFPIALSILFFFSLFVFFFLLPVYWLASVFWMQNMIASGAQFTHSRINCTAMTKFIRVGLNTIYFYIMHCLFEILYKIDMPKHCPKYTELAWLLFEEPLACKHFMNIFFTLSKVP